ncbi:MAG: hypothetical protein AAGF92_14810 [Myxococcota bacterium]
MKTMKQPLCAIALLAAAISCSGESNDDGSGGFGEVTISGVDVGPLDADVGSSFAPSSAAVASEGSTTLVSWEGPRDTEFIIIFEGDSVVDVSFVEPIPDGIDSFFYFLDCDSSNAPAACSAIAIDERGRSVAFNTVALPVSTRAPNNNAATGPITLNGTLRY